MSELLLKVLVRAGQTIHNPFSMGREYVRPERDGFIRDFQEVSKDMKTVGNDLKKTVQRELQRHGK